MATLHKWAFRPRLRRGAFGWRGSRKAIKRLNEAVAEIRRVARTDPALAAEGAVLLLEKLSPALGDVDSSSGALGAATNGVVGEMVPLIAAASVPRRVRERWLERLFEAIQDDDPPYIESLGKHWGVLCGEPELASHWADRLLPLVQLVMAERRTGAFAYTNAGTPCYSALFRAGRFDDLIAVLALDPRPFWHDQQWVAKVMAARGDVDGAVAFIEGMRSPYAPDSALSAMAEKLLLDAGRAEEAYARYAVEATQANTNIATYRAIVKRYPGIDPARILGDLIASTPGAEGKWFATAKTLKQYDLALALARRSPVDPKTLVRAARDHVETHSAFAFEAALLALYWIASGVGYELTCLDVLAAREHALAAARALGRGDSANALVAERVAGTTASAHWARECLGIERG